MSNQYVMPIVSWAHCFLHRQALAAKVFPSDLNGVLREVIKIVNSIKGKTLQTQLFRITWVPLHKNHLYRTEVRWLIKGKVSTRVLELKSIFFLQDAVSEYANNSIDHAWLFILLYYHFSLIFLTTLIFQTRVSKEENKTF